jgi:hypothetical protein
MTNALICWKCGASLAELPLPLGRLAECPVVGRGQSFPAHAGMSCACL